MKFFEQITYQIMQFHKKNPKYPEPNGGFESLVGQMTFLLGLFVWIPSFLFLDTHSTLYIVVFSICIALAGIGIFQAIYYPKRYKAGKIKNDPHPFSERFYRIVACVYIGIPTAIIVLCVIGAVLFLVGYAVYCLLN